MRLSCYDNPGLGGPTVARRRARRQSRPARGGAGAEVRQRLPRTGDLRRASSAGQRRRAGRRAGLLLILGPAALALLPPAAAQAPPAAELFVDATAAAGIDAPHRSSWDEFTSEVVVSGYLGIGQAWGDFDNDGWVDLFLAGGQSPSTLYRNDGDGTFSIPRQAAAVALADSWTGGAVWGDFDNDGWRDLYVLAHGPNVLFRNEAGAGFRDVTAAAGVGDAGKGSGAAWGDYDGDGFLDLFVANWRCFPECPREQAAALASDRLYRNRGDGTFEDVSALLGDKLRGAAFAASFVDFDDDGDLDIYVVNDMVEHPIGNVLWRNGGPGCGGWCWSDASRETGTGAVRNGMGLAVGDYDNDLDLDFYFSDMGRPMALLQNVGGRFRDATEAAGVGAQRSNLVGWGTAFFDFDNDGWLDLVLAASGFAERFGSATGPVGLLLPHANVLFRNRGHGNYAAVTPPGWRERPKPSMGVAYADYDRDGLVDLVVGNFDVGYTLHRNTGLAAAGNHWLTVRLEGRPPVNRDAVGARVFVTTGDGRTRMQEVKSGSSLGAGNDTALHFGLGAWAAAAVRVRWPDGSEAAFAEVAGDRVWRLVYPG